MTAGETIPQPPAGAPAPDDAMPRSPGILFTAFEPSGDDHASIVIAEIKRRRPDLPIFAWGGPKMEAAGATVIERTGDDAVMGVPGLEKIREHRRINKRIADWLDANPVALHVPVDSPAANFPICKLARKRGIGVVHVVAPQLWAWGSWRVRKLRKRTDLVLCLLPFEEKWFAQRQVPARFIGHPLFDVNLDTAALDAAAAAFPEGSPRITLLPGSRPGELKQNFPLLLEAFSTLRRRHPDMVGVLAATRPEVVDHLRTLAKELGGWPDALETVVQQTDAAIRWADLALAVSGTVTLQVARQRTPMVIVYKSNPVMYALLGWWIIDTELFALPNLIAGKEVVPELIPHFGDAKAIIDAADRLLTSPDLMQAQALALNDIVSSFEGHSAGSDAADAILEKLDAIRS